MTTPQESAIGRRTIARSAAWRALELVGAELASFLFMLVMARLLTPAAYGVVATAGFFLAIGQALVMRGLPDALIQRHDLLPKHLDAAFWANLGLGVLAASFLIALAAPMAWLTSKPELEGVLMALAPLLVVFAASGIYLSILRRRMLYRPIAIRSFVSVVAAGAAGSALAYFGASHWSLVGQQVVHALLGLLALVAFSHWYPGLRPSLSHLKDVLSFGLRISGSSLAETAARNTSIIILSCFLSSAMMGSYFLAYRLFQSVCLFTFWSIAELSLPVLSRLQHNPADHREAAHAALRITGMICWPCFIGLALVAEPAIDLLVGPRWSDSVLPLQVLAAFGAFQALQPVAGQILISMGRANKQLAITLQTGLLTTAFLAAAASFGLVPALVAIGAANLAMVPVILRRLDRELGVSALRVLREQLPVMGATLLMAAAVFLAARALQQQSMAVILAVQLLVGAVTYGAALLLLAPGLARQVLAQRRRMAGSPAA